MKALALLVASATLATPALAQGRATLNGVVIGPAGMSQPNVTLILTNTQTNIDRRANSDMDGAFVFGGLQPGTYRLRTDDETFAPFSQDGIVLAGGQMFQIRVTLAPRVPVGAAPTARATVQGTVIGPDGRPFATATIILTNPAGIDRRAVTDMTGAYVFGGLQPGTYRIRVDEMGALPFADNNLMLAPGEMRQFVIRLQPPPPPPVPEAGQPAQPPAGRAAAEKKPEKKKPLEASPVPEVTAMTGEFQAEPNRWKFDWPTYQRYEGNARIPWVVGAPLDPYNQNPAKGDFPIGNSQSLFANVNMQLNSTFNPRQVGAGQFSGTGPVSTNQFFYNNNFVGGLELFRGDGVFEPKRWAVRGTVVGNLNGVNAPASVNTQTYGIEEAFAEKRLAVLDASYDFVSVRGGMQNFNSDFRGYLFVDNQLGVRLFGNAAANRTQYNIAYFSMRDRDAASQLHRIEGNRNQDVIIGNVYIQDFGARGYTGMFNVHVNRDQKTSATQTGSLQVTYVGFHGDGKWGAWSVSHAFYQAFGKDDDNAVARRLGGGGGPRPVDISAQMAALELSRDADWLRYRGSIFYASGDDRSDPGKAKGFDSITDNPNLAGGQFMFWTQQATKADGLGLLSEKFSLLPNLRSKFTDRANFVNPGLVLVNGGVDMRVSPQLKVVTNVSYLKFADATILRLLDSRGFEDNSIGLDVSAGAKYRPFVNENMFVVLGFSTLAPKGGFATAVGSSHLYSFVGAIQLTY